MVKIVHVQTVLVQEDVIKLKAATDCSVTKDALSKAVEFYIMTIGSLSDEQIKKLRGMSGEQDRAALGAAVLTIIQTTLGLHPAVPIVKVREQK